MIVLRATPKLQVRVDRDAGTIAIRQWDHGTRETQTVTLGLSDVPALYHCLDVAAIALLADDDRAAVEAGGDV